MILRTTSIHQPNYLPWLGYFYKIVESETFVFLDNVQYNTSSGVTNRANIKTATGTLFLSIPVKKNKESSLIVDLQIDNAQPWQRKHLNSIFHNYGKSPNFEPVFDLLQKVLNNKYSLLSDLNIALIKDICTYLEIKTPLVKSSELGISSTDRNMRLIEICKKTSGNIYLSGKGAMQYNNAELFKEHGIEIVYSKFTHPEYHQLHMVFEPNLSIIDALFNEGKKTIHLIKPAQQA